MKNQSGFLRRLTALALALCMLAALTSEIFAADIIASGYCGGEGDGTNLTWTLDSDGLLIISGTGKMKDYSNSECSPWYDKVKTAIIQDGVTSVGGYAFYNEYSYNRRGNLTSITIPDSVSSIGASAFNGCSGLTSVTIPDSVIIIGVNAFGQCVNLTNIVLSNSLTGISSGMLNSCISLNGITIPNGVTTIDGYAFSGSGLTSITLPDSVTTIKYNAFHRCSSLVSVIIPDSVTSIEKEAFRGCSSLTSITLPDGVTSIEKNTFYECSSLTSIIIPDGVTSIGEKAFDSCSSLMNITIPNSVTSIGTLAFFGCSSLTSITIPSSVTSMGGIMFDDCSSLERVAFLGNAPASDGFHFLTRCPSSTKIYYVQGKKGWTDSTEYDAAVNTWHGYKLEVWNGKALPTEAKVSVPKGKYCIQVIDETGAAISGAEVTWNDASDVTDQEGKVFFNLTTAGNPVIYVTKTDYITWTNKNSNWQKDEKRFERVILYPESYGGLKLKSAKIGRCDLLAQTKVLNLHSDADLITEFGSGHFDLTCEATDTSDVTGYLLYQNDKLIAGSFDGKFKDLDVGDFVKGGGCFVRVANKDKKSADTHINLQFAKNSINEDFKFELKGNKISVDVPNDIPLVGGHSLTFELPLEAPVIASITTDKVQLGLNLKLTEDKTRAEQIDSYIKTIKKAAAAGGTNLTKASAKALKNCAAQHNKAELFNDIKDIDFTVCGYAEADFGSNTASGYMIFIVDVKLADIEYNTVLWAVPITVQVGADFKLKTGGTGSYRFDTKTWNWNLFLNPSVGLHPFAGVGFSKVVGVGVYGDGELAIKWNVRGTNSGLQSADLTAELGLKGYIGPMEVHKAFAHQTWHLYTANSVKTQSLRSGTAWDASPEASEYTPSDLSYLAEESDWAPAAVRTYAARAAQARTEYHPLLKNTYRNAQPVMVSDGSALYAAFVRADEETGKRYVALSKFNGTSWSDPVAVDASAILDDAPQLCTDAAGNLWLAYARTTRDPGNSLVTYAQNQTIVVGTVNKDTLAFTEQKTYQSNEYMHLPTLSCVNGTPVLAWAGSAVTDQESVVNPALKTIYTAKYENGTWPDAQKVTEAAAVSSLCIGAQNGAPAVAYTADGKLCCSGIVLAENVTGRAIYGKLPGTAGESFIWNADGALHDESKNTVPVEGLGRDFVIVGDSIYFNQSNGASANLAVLQYDAKNTRWSAPILLIGDEKYLENLNAAMLGGKTYALGMHTTVTIGTDSVEDSKDLVWTQIQPVSDLKLSDVSFNSETLVPGEVLPVTFTVTNSGDHTVTGLTLTADGASSARDCELLPGESEEFTVDIACPSKKQTVTFAVQETGKDDYTPEDNTAACTIGSADAETELTLIQIGSRRLLQAAVTNRGLETASGSVLFAGPDGALLAERTFQNLTYGGTVIAEFEPESFSDLYGEDVTATVTLQQDEPNTLNNTDSVPILLTATEILSAQRGGSSVTAEIACMHDSARALCAFYDATGRLLRTVIQPLESGKINSPTFQIDSNAAQAKLFVLDVKNAPAAPARSIPLNS